MRFIVMAVLRAPTIATSTQTSVRGSGTPFDAKNSANSANGSAKIVCSNLTVEQSPIAGSRVGPPMRHTEVAPLGHRPGARASAGKPAPDLQ
jgi:hypothetical protein